MTPALFPDEDIIAQLTGDLSISLLFPHTTIVLVHTAAEYAHRFGRAHASTALIGRAARLFRPQRTPDTFDEDNHARDNLIALWRMSGVTWTRRRPPHWLPKDSVLHVPAIDTRYAFHQGTDERGQPYVNRYRVHAYRTTGVILQDLERHNAYVAPTFEVLERRYRPVAAVRRVYRFGGQSL